MGTTEDRTGPEAVQLSRLVEFKYWNCWATEPLGVGLSYSFGADTADLLAWPCIAGRPTGAVGLLQTVMVGLGAWLLLRAQRQWWSDRPGVAAFFGAGVCQTDLILNAVLWGFGLVLTATCLRFYRHYLVLAFPFPLLGLARLALPPRATPRQRLHARGALLTICVASALITATTLCWVHEHGGTETGGYWRTYASQLDSGEMPEVPPLDPW
jgi:hypothetical protein